MVWQLEDDDCTEGLHIADIINCEFVSTVLNVYMLWKWNI